MLNKDSIRELAYIVTIDAIEPIIGSDNCEAAVVGGWRVMVRKDTFKAGDIGIYFEIDSHVDTSKPEFAFLEKKHGNIKTQKYTFGGKGNFISQGLIMHPADLNWEVRKTEVEPYEVFAWDGAHPHFPHDESRFVTEILGVTYATSEDNSRKANSVDKYKVMAQRRPNIFKHKWARWFMRRAWGRKVMFFFFGRKKDKRSSWPEWVKKTDEERIQNSPWVLQDENQEWIATEKVDGSSTTFAIRGFGRKRKFYVCSRNVVFDKPDKKCYYDTNIYTEMAEKYNMEKVMGDLLDEYHARDKAIEFLTIQAETYGSGVQKRDYSKPNGEHDMAIFNIIWGFNNGTAPVRLNPIEGRAFAVAHGLPYVPVIGQMTLPNNVDEVLALAGAEPSRLDNGMREGLVFRSLDGAQSFKAVDNNYLLIFHQ